MRSTLRRDAMATPASVHCVSRQFVFGDLSCTGLRRKIWHPRHHCLFTIHIVSHWIVPSSCTSWIFWIRILRSCGFGHGRQPSPRTQTMASHQSCFLSVSCRCCTRCFLCSATVQSRNIVNLVNSFWIQASNFLRKISNPSWNM